MRGVVLFSLQAWFATVSSSRSLRSRCFRRARRQLNKYCMAHRDIVTQGSVARHVAAAVFAYAKDNRVAP